jgi:hypothetical protein
MYRAPVCRSECFRGSNALTVIRRAMPLGRPGVGRFWRPLLPLLAALGLVLLSFLLLVPSPALRADGPHYVSTTGTDSDVCSMYAPCATIHRAVLNAASGDEIRVAAGAYYNPLNLNKDLTIVGGYTTTDWLRSDPEANVTRLDAQRTGRVVTVGLGRVVVIQGMQLTGGNAPAPETDGGGVYNLGDLTLIDSQVFDNLASNLGAGLVSAGSTARLRLVDTRVFSNTSSSVGGGIGVNGGIVSLEASAVFSNSADNAGGGIYVQNGSLLATSSVIYNNRLPLLGGGGIQVNAGSLTLVNTTVYSNATQQDGGGVNVFNGSLAITNSLIVSNTALMGGGVYSSSSALGVQIAYSDFFANSPDQVSDNGAEVSPAALDSSNRITNPLFLDGPGYDLHLTYPGSPAVDSGTITGAATYDYDGEGRPFGSGVDRGADEYTAASDCYARIHGGRVYTGLQAAVDAAASGDTVLAAGHCVAVERGGITQSLYIDKDLTVRGGYTVTDWVDEGHATYLDAQGMGRGVYVTGSSLVTLEGLYVTGGSGSPGAGVYLGSDVDATVQNNVIYDNHATGFGGGLYSAGGDTTLQFNTVAGNSASDGGGVYVQNSGEMTVRNNVVVSNTAASSGGGIEGPPSGVSLDYNDFFGNSASTGNPDYGAVISGAHDIAVDPLFESIPDADYHLTLVSPVIHRADPGATLAVDFEGDSRPRPEDWWSDMGADETLQYAAVILAPALESPRIVTDTSLISGQTITFSHVITNIGTTPTLSDTYDIEVVNSQDWGWRLVGISSPRQVYNGESAAFQVVVTAPTTLAQPVYNQTVITVTSRSNATAYAVRADEIVQRGVLLVPSYTDNADPGEVVTYTHVMTNIGMTDTFTLSLRSSLGWGQLITPTGLVTLTNGAMQLVAVQVRVTDTAPVNLADVLTLTVVSLNDTGIRVTVTDTTIANATTGPRYVCTDGANVNNNCKVKTSPCSGIAYAVGQAAWGDDILVAQGTYSQPGGVFLTQPNDLKGGYDDTFTIQSGRSEVDVASTGRGLRVSVAGPSQPEVSNLRIVNAQSSGVGGGVYLQGTGSPRLVNVEITDSSASRGGGVYIEGGSPVLQGVAVFRTQAEDRGGGIYVAGGGPTLQNVSISGTSAISGGAIFNLSGAVQASGVTVYASNASQGGGIYQAGGSLNLVRSTVASNTAAVGGGLYAAGGSVSLVNNFVYSNTTSSGAGGGLYAGGASLTVVNNSLAGNSAATYGGGVYGISGSQLAITNTILAWNAATVSGGGLYRDGTGTGIVDYNDFYGNAAPDMADSNVTTGTHSIAVDPGFLDRGAGDLHLDYDSPVVDLADPATYVTNDIDNDLRPINQGFDIGADEVTGCLARNTRFPWFEYGVLQQAVDEARDHDIIQVAGTCRGVQARSVDGQVMSQTVYISRPLVLQGGFDLGFAYDPANVTTLDAQGLGRVMVVSDTDVAMTVVVSRLNIVGGNAGEEEGGGIYHSSTNPDSRLRLWGAVISESQAAAGGAVFNQGARLEIDADAERWTQIFSNTATYGGGVYVAGGESQIQRTWLLDNTGDQGGGIYNSGESTKLSYVLAMSNTALNGGALYNQEGLMTAQAITVSANLASSGAGVFNAGGAMGVAGSWMLFNEADNEGGAVRNATGASLYITNTMVASNTAGTDGGGLYNESDASGSVEVRHSTFYDNYANDEGGGIHHTGSTAAPVFNSNLLLNNSAGSVGDAIYNVSTKPAFDYNDVPAAGYGGNLLFGDGVGNVDLAVTFVSLDPYSPSFLHLPSGSPVEDIADPASPVAEDIDGDPRPSNRGFDMGADEIGGCYVRINGLAPTYGNIQLAAETASSGDRLLVAGTCQGVNQVMSGGMVMSQTLYISKSLTLEGGYALDDWTASYPITQPTYLDAAEMGRVMVVTDSAVVNASGLRFMRGSADTGGGVLVGSGSLSMTLSWVYSHTADSGGGMYLEDGTVHLGTDTEIYGCTAVNGGGIYQANGELLANDVLLSDNDATAGGAFYFGDGLATVQNSILSDNTADDGGGIYQVGDGLVVRHNDFYQNSAVNGGGLYLTSAAADVRNNVFLQGSATGAGHAVYGQVAVGLDYNDAYPASNAYNANVTSGSHSLTVDPLFVDPANGDFHLQDASPVIDVGDPSITLLFDFEGDLRPGDQGFDMGADEVASCTAKVMRTSIVYGNVQRAIYNSLPGDEIRVSAGICRGVHPLDLGGHVVSQTVHVTHSLTLDGGYESDFDAKSGSGPTILDAEGLGRTLLVTNSAVVTVADFALYNGDAAGLGGGPAGADAGGNAYYAGGGGALQNLTIISGTADYGGGLFNATSGLTMTGGLIRQNAAGSAGGGVFNLSDAMVMRSITVTLNSASTGGGVYNQSGTMRLESNHIVQNEAVGVSAAGGGFYNEDGSPILDLGNHFFLNTSEQDGGALYSANGNMQLWNTLVYSNTASGHGGGLYVAAGTPEVYHNDFYRNAANASTGHGGGVFVDDGPDPAIWNNLFWLNVSSLGEDLYAGGPDIDYNYFTDLDRIHAPEIGEHNLITPDAPGLTDPAAGDFHLLSSSILIDEGGTLSVDHDFESDPRPVNDSWDIGADEYNGCLAKVVSTGDVYGRVQSAVDAAADGDTVQVAEGVCYESVTIDKDLTVQGSWSKDFSGMDAGESIINAAWLGSRVVTVNDVDDVSLYKLTFKNGQGANGGGLWSAAANLNLAYVTVVSNTATNGGGVYLSTGTADLQEVTISDNTASTSGGGLYVDSGCSVDIGGGGMSGNEATSGNGGAIYQASGSDVAITGGTALSDNQASLGGGVYVGSASFALAQKQINENTASSGAGMYVTGSSAVTMTNLGMYGNTATTGDGGGSIEMPRALSPCITLPYMTMRLIPQVVVSTMLAAQWSSAPASWLSIQILGQGAAASTVLAPRMWISPTVCAGATTSMASR